MSSELKKARDRIASFSYTITFHVVSCIVYGDSLNYYDSWIRQTLADKFKEIGNTTTTKKSGVLNEGEYEKLVFSYFLNMSKLKKVIDDVYQERVVENGNPPFNTESYKLLKSIQNCGQELSSKLCEVFSRHHRKFEKEDFVELLHEIIDKYALDANRDWLYH